MPKSLESLRGEVQIAGWVQQRSGARPASPFWQRSYNCQTEPAAPLQDHQLRGQYSGFPFTKHKRQVRRERHVN